MTFRQFTPYRHYKGGLYLKLCEAREEATGEVVVVYVCAVSGDVFTRPKADFETEVTVDNVAVPRFEKIGYSTGKEERKAVLKDILSHVS